jgi:hypothetical protein
MMASVGTESTSISRRFRSLRSSYPDIRACVGAYLGRFHGRDWYDAAGKARDTFEVSRKEVRELFNTAWGTTYTNSAGFALYVIGRELDSAMPTIMLWGEEKQPRKQAKKAFEKNGLLKRLPGFRIGQVKRNPTFQRIIQPAIIKEYRQLPDWDIDIYYDPTCEVRAIGMPIFVKDRIGSWRKATAYRVFKDDQCCLMSVAHVFEDRAEDLRNDTLDDDNDIDFGSEKGSDFEEDDQNIIALPTTNSSSRCSSEGRNLESTGEILDIETGSLPIDARSAMDAGSSDHVVSSDQSDRLLPFGKLEKAFSDLDWALVSIEDYRVKSQLSEDKSALGECYIGGNPVGEKAIVCLTRRGKEPSGHLSANTVDIRLPGSRKFQEVYVMVLDEAIGWGDCGALVTDGTYSTSFGHVVASSEDMYTIFIIPAVKILEQSGFTWGNAWRTSRQTQTQKSGLPGDMDFQPGYTDTRKLSNKAPMVPASGDSGNDRSSTNLTENVYHDEAFRRVNEEMQISKLAPSDRAAAIIEAIWSPRALSSHGSNTQGLTEQADEMRHSVRTGNISSSSPVIMPSTEEGDSESEVDYDSDTTMATEAEQSFDGPSQPKSMSNLDMEASTGGLVAKFGHWKFCWEATGKVREDFMGIRALLIKQIDEAIGTEIPANDFLTFSFYMIGKNEASAVPTMLIISRNSDQRRAVKKFLDKGGLLQRFPHFSIRTASKDPASTQIMTL